VAGPPSTAIRACRFPIIRPQEKANEGKGRLLAIGLLTWVRLVARSAFTVLEVAADWAYLHLNFCGGLRKTHLFCNRVRVSRSRSFKVVDFGINRKGVCDFQLVINSNFGPILHLFWDTATYWLKICEFFLPHSYLTSSLGVNPFEFLDELFTSNTIVLKLSVVKISRS